MKTTTSFTTTSKRWACGPLWMRRRSLGMLPPNKQQMSPSNDLILRLKQEACLNGHKGCVNCLDWNQKGDQLASGSDDTSVIIWDPFRRKKQNVIETGHEGSIFSVKFMPSSSDTLVATGASDGMVKMTSIYRGENLLDCNSCHNDRVKRLAIHQTEPNIIWSASEDGLILEYDIRQVHVCNNYKSPNTLIDLKTISNDLQAKCIAINPLRSEMLAVGSNDIYTRLFDRRFIKLDAASKSSTGYFAPGHLLRTNNRSNHIQRYGTTYLSFNSTGSELLASYHAEQIYLFNILEPWDRFQSFETSLKPILLDKELPRKVSVLHAKSNLQLKKLRELKAIYTLNGECQNYCDISHKDTIDLSVINQLNTQLDKIQNCTQLYLSRSSALQRRGWRGDDYQALRDCCCALVLDPTNSQTIFQLLVALRKLGDHNAANELSNFIKLNQSEYETSEICEFDLDKLSSCKHKRTSSGSNSFEVTHSNIYDIYTDPNHTMTQLLDSQSSYYSKLKHKFEKTKNESDHCTRSFDYNKRFTGHCNMNTDIKEASFLGPNDEYIVGGSDDGAFYIWNKNTTNVVKAVQADHEILNCVQPNPRICMIASSGIESDVKLWSPNGSVDRDVKSLETRCAQNQKFISTDPLEAMIMMLYPE